MQLYITDKTGKKFWSSSVSAEWSKSEYNNLRRHLAAIKARDPAYAKCNVDSDTARIVAFYDKWDYPETNPRLMMEDRPVEMSDDELLAELSA